MKKWRMQFDSSTWDGSLATSMQPWAQPQHIIGTVSFRYLPMIGVSTTAGRVSANPKMEQTDPRYLVARWIFCERSWLRKPFCFALKPWGLAESPSDQPLVRARGCFVTIFFRTFSTNFLSTPFCSPNSFSDIWVLTSSLGIGDRDFSRVVAGGGVFEGVAEGVVWGAAGSAR